MTDDPSLWNQLGIRLADLVGGAAGGSAAGIAFRKSDVYSFLGSIVIGAFTAAYLTAWAVQFAGNFAGGASFVVGLCAMTICQVIVKGAAKWIPGGKDGPK